MLPVIKMLVSTNSKETVLPYFKIKIIYKMIHNGEKDNFNYIKFQSTARSEMFYFPNKYVKMHP